MYVWCQLLSADNEGNKRCYMYCKSTKFGVLFNFQSEPIVLELLALCVCLFFRVMPEI